MPSLAEPDLAGLASQAQRPGVELRPLLLTLHARAFATAAIHDRRAIATFEALACGLIPLVPAHVLSEVAVLLATVPDAPDSVLALLDRRLARGRTDATGRHGEGRGIERGSVDDLLARGRPDIDLSLAANTSLRLDGRVLATLVDRAASSNELGRRLLARSELSTFDRASLYRAADEGTRDTIRDSLGLRLAVTTRAPRPASAARRARMMKLALRGDGFGLLREVSAALRLQPPAEWRLDMPEEAEFLALALTALDLPADECGRIFLTADPTLARSVRTVFRLMRVRRTTPAHVAAYLVGAGPAFRKGATKSRADAKARAAASKPASRRKAPGGVSAAPARSRGASVPPGRRSRSTRDRDRT